MGPIFWPANGEEAAVLARWCFSFMSTVTIIPFMPNGWAASAGGFPAMTGNVSFLMKDVVLLAASFYLLRQDVARAAFSTRYVHVVLISEAMPSDVQACKVLEGAGTGSR